MTLLVRLSALMILILFLAGISALSVSLALVKEYSVDLPSAEKVLTHSPPQIGLVQTSGAVESFEFATEKRVLISYEMIPQHVLDAFVSAEDKNFWTHRGVDSFAILRAAITNFTSEDSTIGGSTITQQLVKNLLLSSERSLPRKIKEVLLSMQVEDKISKERILELYLNEIYFGRGAYGIEAAAQTYFNVSTEQLNIAQSAFLAALPKAPSTYSNNKDLAQIRREYVLGRMFEDKKITESEYREALVQPLPFEETKQNLDSKSQSMPHFVNASMSEIEQVVGLKDLMTSGVSVELTIDSTIQELAEKSLRTGLFEHERRQFNWKGPVQKDITSIPDASSELPTEWEYGLVSSSDEGSKNVLTADGKSRPLNKVSLQWIERSGQSLDVGDLIIVEAVSDEEVGLRQIPTTQGAIVVMDPKTGGVLAISGAFDDRITEFNRASQAMRQPGSSLKPFIYLLALQQGWTPASPIPDTYIAFESGSDEIWRPNDHGESDRGFITLRSGLEYSRNTVTLRLFEDVGIDRFSDFVKRLGIYESLPKENSVALGSAETTLLQLTSAYSIFVSDGIYRPATFMKKASWKDGREWLNPKLDPQFYLSREPVTDVISAAQIRSMLQGATQYGTAWRAFDGVEYDVAGKTGTSNESRDTWFIGFTPEVMVGVFVGYDVPSDLGDNESGGNTAAPIARTLIDSLPNDFKDEKFLIPEEAVVISIDPDTGIPVDDGFMEIFKPGDIPEGQ